MMTVKLLFKDGDTWQDANIEHVRINLQRGMMLLRGRHGDGTDGMQDVQVKSVDMDMLISISVSNKDRL